MTAQFLQTEQPTGRPVVHQDDTPWTDPYDQQPAWHEWAKMLLVLTLAAGAFAPALLAGWAWKDHDFVQLDESPGTLGGMLQHWTNPRLDEIYQPVAYTSYWVQYLAWEGAAPVWCHAIGVGFHLLNVLLLWRILRRLEVVAAVWIVGLFAVHPVMVQSVTWVSAQPVVMSATFVLMSMLFWLRLTRIEPPTHLPLVEVDVPEWRRCVTYLLSLGFFVLALLTEPAVCALPAVLFLVTHWKKHHLTHREKMGIAPFVGAALVMVGVVIWAQKTRTSLDAWTISPIERLFIAARALWFHIAKLAFPWPLLFVYPRWNIAPQNIFNWAGLIGVAGAVAAAWHFRAKLTVSILAAIAAFLLFLLPWFVLINVAQAPSFVADYQQYLAAIGIIVITGSLLASWAERAKMLTSAQVIFATLILLVLCGLTVRQNFLYGSSQRLWEHTLHYNANSSVANFELGNSLLDQQNFDQAEKYLAKAVELRPTDSQAVLQYGTVLERQAVQLFERDRPAGMKKLDVAETFYRKWQEKQPKNSAPVRCLAGIENLRGNRAIAITLYQRALALNPNDDIAENNLATALARQGQVDDAMAHYQRALDINPKLVQAHLNMAGLLFGIRKNQDAFNHIELALKADRSNFDAYMSAGGVCMQMKLFNDASRMFRRAAALRSNSPNAWNALGCSLAAQNHLDEAVECFGRALDLKPEYEDARANLASAKKQRG